MTNLQKIKSFSFDVWAYKEEELIPLAFSCFSPLLKNLHLTKEVAASFLLFLTDVKKNYSSFPYHNFRHALDVLQFLFILQNRKALDIHLDPWEQFALLISGLCHDVGHNGKNNLYHIKHQTPLYQKYGEFSPMEKYHANLTKKLLSNYFNSFFPLENKKKKEIKKMIFEWILSTDINTHSNWMKLISSSYKMSPQIVGILAIKTADLGQLLRPKYISEIWIGNIFEEFYLQAKEEKEVSNKRDFLDLFAKEQKKFVTQVAFPLFQEFKKRLSIKI